MRYDGRSEHVSLHVCVRPNMRPIIWFAALKQRGSGPVYSQGEAPFSQKRENETM